MVKSSDFTLKVGELGFRGALILVKFDQNFKFLKIFGGAKNFRARGGAKSNACLASGAGFLNFVIIKNILVAAGFASLVGWRG